MGQTLAPTMATWEVELGTDRCAESNETVMDSSSTLGSPVVPPDMVVQYSLDKQRKGESERVFNFEICEEGGRRSSSRDS